jgi:CRP-like cAMP-binding protein
MHDLRGRPYKNFLLRKMEASDFALIQPKLERVELKKRDVLDEPHQAVQYAYFVEEGILSVLSEFEGDREVEVGVVGCEGMSATSVLLGDALTTYITNVQMDGFAMRLSIPDLLSALRKSRSMHKLLLLYVRAFEIQIASTASANGRAKLDERLARWLLMAHDRMEGDRLDITHDFLSRILASRRPGVTVSLHILEGKKLIRSNRGHVIITDRQGLEQAARGSYGAAEAEYMRLFGQDFRAGKRQRLSILG